jgi:hypothetical protein
MIRDGRAESRRIVENPVRGIGEVIPDFDTAGRPLGIASSTGAPYLPGA